MKPIRKKSYYVDSGSSSGYSSCSSASISSGSRASVVSSCCSSGASSHSFKKTNSYKRIRNGLRKSIPAAIVLYAFHKIPTRSLGLTSRQVITFLKKRYRVVDDPRRTGKSIGSMLRCAVEFGLLEKKGQKYFLARTRERDRR